MASHGNPNPPGFGMNKLFKPSACTSNQNPQNAVNNGSNSSSPFSSYPSPTGGANTYSCPPQTSHFHHYPQFYRHPMYNAPSNPANMHLQRSSSHPTHTLQHQLQPATSPHHQNIQNPPISQNPNNTGVRLMASLSAPPSTLEIPQQPTMPMPPTIYPSSSGGSDFSPPVNVRTGQNLGISQQGPMMRMTSSKLPKGRNLMGDHLVYDVDVRLPGEVQPQLEVTPITKYGSDPGLFLGRQIAVNKAYKCYGLKLGAITVLNIKY